MKTLNWVRTGWTASDFVLSLGQDIIGQLTFSPALNSKAVYADNNLRLKFIQSFFGSGTISITQDEKPIGEIVTRVFGGTTLELITGEKYKLGSNFWGFNFYWENASGERIMRYESTALSKGTIEVYGMMTKEMEILLSSSGLFVKQSRQKRILLTIGLISLVRILSHSF